MLASAAEGGDLLPYSDLIQRSNGSFCWWPCLAGRGGRDVSENLSMSETTLVQETLSLEGADPCQILVLYEDAVAHDVAMEVCGRVLARFEAELTFAFSFWKFKDLDNPVLAHWAAEAVARADVVLFSLPGRELSPEIMNWLDMCVQARTKAEGALAVMVTEHHDMDTGGRGAFVPATGCRPSAAIGLLAAPAGGRGREVRNLGESVTGMVGRGPGGSRQQPLGIERVRLSIIATGSKRGRPRFPGLVTSSHGSAGPLPLAAAKETVATLLARCYTRIVIQHTQRPVARFSAAGFSLLELFLVAVIIFILFTLSISPRSKSHQEKALAECQNHLQNIYAALRTFSGDNQAALPAVPGAETSETPLSLLVPKYTTGSEYFICPGGQDKALPEARPFAAKTATNGISVKAPASCTASVIAWPPSGTDEGTASPEVTSMLKCVVSVWARATNDCVTTFRQVASTSSTLACSTPKPERTELPRVFHDVCVAPNHRAGAGNTLNVVAHHNQSSCAVANGPFTDRQRVLAPSTIMAPTTVSNALTSPCTTGMAR